jgi:6 kDa early secretory antigenic target
MTTSGITVTFATISQAQGDIASTASRMNSTFSDLKSYLAPLVASWEGAAASEYQTLQARWDNAANDLNVVLEQISRITGQTHDNYRATESANTAVWA